MQSSTKSTATPRTVIFHLVAGLVVILAWGLTMVNGFAQAGLNVGLSKTQLIPGDTLVMEAKVENYPYKYGTLYAWIEDANHTRQWKLRYPMQQGGVLAAIVLPDSFPEGVYALNFMVRRELVHLMGRLKNRKPPSQINMMGMAGNKEMTAMTIMVDEEGYFQVPNLVFDEKASFVFSPTGKHSDNWLDVILQTPVDSSFYPLAEARQFITVGRPAIQTDTAQYYFSQTEFNQPKGTLQDVVVTGKLKTESDKYAEKYISGFFDKEGYLFDGLEDNLIAAAPTVLDFLTGRVAGLQVYNNRDSGGMMVHWRGYEPAYFVDGFETDLESIQAINTSDIAIVKVMRPPFYGVSMGSAGGAIAVFLKKGVSSTGFFGNKYRFVVYGYTPLEYVLQ